MDRAHAERQAGLVGLQCGGCGRECPGYRILVGKGTGVGKQLQCRGSSSMRDTVDTGGKKGYRRNTSTEKMNLPSRVCQQAPRSRKYSQFASLSDSTTPSEPNPHLCLSCVVQSGRPLSSFHAQTYQQLMTRFIKQLPLPDYSLMDECLKVLHQIETKSTAIVKQIEAKLQQFRFYMLRLGGQVRKLCGGYADKVRYFQQLRLRERFDLEMEIIGASSEEQALGLYRKLRQKFQINQGELIEQLGKKLAQLRAIHSKTQQIKFTFPSFQQPPTPARKKHLICDIPISSMTHFNGRRYYGTADGRIIYPSSSFLQLAATKAHQSLIRSFSHDSQYTLYSGSDDFSIKAWCTRTGTLQHIQTFGVMENCRSYHRNIFVQESGKSLVSTRGQFDNFQIRVWSLEGDYGNIGCLDGHDSFIKAMVIVDRQRDIIITGADDKKVKIWDSRNFRLLHTVSIPKKIHNLICNQALQLVAIIDQDNTVSILDLTELNFITSWHLPRRILCSTGYSRLTSLQPDADYLLLAQHTNIGIWTWNGIRIWSHDTENSFTPVSMMQQGPVVVVSDGTGSVDEFLVGGLGLGEL